MLECPCLANPPQLAGWEPKAESVRSNGTSSPYKVQQLRCSTKLTVCTKTVNGHVLVWLPEHR